MLRVSGNAASKRVVNIQLCVHLDFIEMFFQRDIDSNVLPRDSDPNKSDTAHA